MRYVVSSEYYLNKKYCNLISLFQISVFPKILDELLNLEFLDLYDNKLIECPSLGLDSSIKSLDLEQNFFSTEKNIDLDFTVSFTYY